MCNIRPGYSAVVIFVVLLLFTVLAANAQTSPRIEVKSSGFFINGAAVTMPVGPADLYEVIGKPDRNVEGARRVWVWDRLGLIGYQPLESENFIEIGIILDIKTYVFPFTPSTPFSGSLTIDGAKVTAKSTRNTLNRGKTGVKFKALTGVGMLSESKTGEFYLVAMQKEVLRDSGSGKIVHIAVSKAEKEY